MSKQEIGIVVVATNAYFVLGLRFITRFNHFYKGNKTIKFYFFSDTSPKDFVPSTLPIEFYQVEHENWVEGTNSKFKSILNLKNCSSDYLYYFDADTNVQKDFTAKWMLGVLVGGEHFENKGRLANGEGFDRNPEANSYVPLDSKLPYTYHYGAFFGGIKPKVLDMCKKLREWQIKDQSVGYEPPVNDESYINKYFHFTPPYTVPTKEFEFVISDKGGIGNTRNMNLRTIAIKASIKLNKDVLWDIQNNKITYGT